MFYNCVTLVTKLHYRILGLSDILILLQSHTFFILLNVDELGALGLGLNFVFAFFFLTKTNLFVVGLFLCFKYFLLFSLGCCGLSVSGQLIA